MSVCPLARGPADIADVRARGTRAPGGDVGVVPAGRAAGDAEAPAGPLHAVRRPEGPRRWVRRATDVVCLHLPAVEKHIPWHGMAVHAWQLLPSC